MSKLMKATQGEISAQERYKAIRKEIEDNIRQMRKSLLKHARRHEKHPTIWGYVGDIAHINHQLRDLNAYFKP